MPRTITMRAYRFEELKGKALKRALEWGREHDFLWDTDQVTEVLQEALREDFGIYQCEVYWSLGHCQDDHVQIAGLLDLDSMAAKDEELKRLLEGYQMLRAMADDEACEASVRVTEREGIDVDVFCGGPHDGMEVCDQFFEQLKAYIEWRVDQIHGKLMEIGYAEIDAFYEDEYVADWLEANGYEFNRKGEPL